MMNRSLWMLVLAVVPALTAQEAPDSARAPQLRLEVERRFAERVQRELSLTPDQATKLRATHDRFQTRRQTLAERQRDLRWALDDQMRPGVAANPDSVRKLMDALQSGRADMLRMEQEEDREMAAYLTPVQRARLQMLRQRLHDRVVELRRRRGGGPGGPMDRPRRPPGQRPRR